MPRSRTWRGGYPRRHEDLRRSGRSGALNAKSWPAGPWTSGSRSTTREALNKLPDERLTAVDVEQRIHALRYDVSGCPRGPDKGMQEESFAAYATEKANGTEFVSLLGWLDQWTLGADERFKRKQEEERRQRIEQEKRRAEARLRSGADSPWTAVATSTTCIAGPEPGRADKVSEQGPTQQDLSEVRTTRPLRPYGSSGHQG